MSVKVSKNEIPDWIKNKNFKHNKLPKYLVPSDLGDPKHYQKEKA